MIHRKILGFVLLFTLIVPIAFSRSWYDAIHSGSALFDRSGKEVNAHGACIVQDGGRFYLFGEYKSDTANVFSGFSCYSSTDLMNWTFVRIVLPVQKEGMLSPHRVGERVKVMRCPSTGEFVMYMHTDDATYKDPQVGYATCSRIDGEYTFQGALLFEGKPIRKWDMGTFQDYDGKGYLLIHHGFIYELSSDYRSVKRMVASRQPGGEAPVIFRKGGRYFWLSSGLTSWERNDNSYLTATSLEGPWIPKGLFAPKGSLTWNSQSTFALPLIQDKDTLILYMGDRWSFPKQGSSATYVWQPFVVNGEELSLPQFHSAWRIGPGSVAWQEVDMSGRPLEPASQKGDWKLEDGLLVAHEKGSIVSYAFSGRQVALKVLADSTSGYGNVVIRDRKGREVFHSTVDFYCKYPILSTPFVSPILPKDLYTLTIEVTGEHPVWSDKRVSRYGSTDNYIRIVEVSQIK